MYARGVSSPEFRGEEDYASEMRRQSQLAAIKAAEIARRALADLPPEKEKPKTNTWRSSRFVGLNPTDELLERLGRGKLRSICLNVSRSTDVTVRELRGPNKTKRIVTARYKAWLISFQAGYTVSQIGRYYGKDHTSVRHGIARASGMPPFVGAKPIKGVIAEYLAKIRAESVAL